jgi:hypothetical protein
MKGNSMTTQEHWELHQGLWSAINCDMHIKYQDNNKIVYVDKNSKWEYTYSKGFIERKKNVTSR